MNIWLSCLCIRVISKSNLEKLWIHSIGWKLTILATGLFSNLVRVIKVIMFTEHRMFIFMSNVWTIFSEKGAFVSSRNC